MPQTTAIDAVKLQRHRFLGFSFALADLLIELDAEGRVTFAAGASQHLFGQNDASLIGEVFLERIAPEHRPLVKQLLRQLDVSPRIPPVEIAVERVDGASEEVVFCGYALPHEPSRYLVLSALERFRALIEQGEGRDPETGLHTATGFADRLRDLIHSEEESAGELTMTIMELEGIDQLENSAKPGAYQDVINGVAAFLRLRSFGGDSAGVLEEGRFGVVTAADIDHAELTNGLLEAVPETRGLTTNLHSQTLRPVGMSPDTSARTLIYALQRFQREGLNAEVRADPGTQFRNLLKETLEAIERFQGIIDTDQIALAYQPIVELESGRIHHYEVLARLPEGESPFESVSLGESIGLIPAFDLTVCRKALADLDTEGVDENLQLAVNLSAESLQEEVFVDALDLLLRRYDKLRRRLSFEVTESAEIKDFTAVNAAIQRLRGLGCGVALDDFGAGHATFRYLQAFEVDYVKMDGAYVHAMADSPRDYAVIKGMANICRELDLVMIAEMIETEQQVELLKALGVKLGQGYLFGGPAIGRPEIAMQSRQLPGVGSSSPTLALLRSRRQGVRETWM
ncbi:EAL domain-containing protein [Algihabitans albus]|uniref:EAL domain-containing protein n=1 Tax=Algihabitans albus TaxID=2164067 RepID=UPI000E5D42A6|nr:EAL domain-containing protein [Algihabitans albus]